jgi:hypothetical protein
MNLDLTRELEPDTEYDDAEFKIALPLTPWDDEDNDDKDNGASKQFDRSLNRYGAVYVRLLRAQRCVSCAWLWCLVLPFVVFFLNWSDLVGQITMSGG